MLGSGEAGYQEQAVKGLLMGSRLWGESAKASALTGVADGNDYMLTYITACYGILAAVVLTGLILFLFLRFLKISMGQKNQLGMAMGAGCASVFIIQLLTCLLINVGLLPAASVYLPFISYGGSGALAVYLLLGILLSIYRYQNVLPACLAGSGSKTVRSIY
ncbi:FtsW/RodA/SpoVE family cell cycle protein [[Clostridium] scindens]|uniref:FtsW/RodA/SpoVE family cell cycle protein n=1 Tax=Clostridium scindens (strain JCM 10418 / VPI 12708) TaxID=29347 RepID=UPI0039A2F1AF